MARMEVTMPTDLIRKLEKLGSKGNEISAKMLVSGAKILKSKVDENLKRNIYTDRTGKKGYPTGDLEKSITIDKPKKSKNGASYITIFFKGNDSKGASNNLKAMVMEYGKTGQPAKPFIRPSTVESEKEVNIEMQRIFDTEVAKL